MPFSHTARHCAIPTHPLCHSVTPAHLQHVPLHPRAPPCAIKAQIPHRFGLVPRILAHTPSNTTPPCRLRLMLIDRRPPCQSLAIARTPWRHSHLCRVALMSSVFLPSAPFAPAVAVPGSSQKPIPPVPSLRHQVPRARRSPPRPAILQVDNQLPRQNGRRAPYSEPDHLFGMV